MILRLQTLSKRASRRPELEAHLVAERADVSEELILPESLTKMTRSTLLATEEHRVRFRQHLRRALYGRSRVVRVNVFQLTGSCAVRSPSWTFWG